MNKQNSPSNELQKRLYFVFAWFILSLIGGVLSLIHFDFIGVTLIFLTFLVFNVFTTLYNLIIFTTKKVIEEEQVKCRSAKH